MRVNARGYIYIRGHYICVWSKYAVTIYIYTWSLYMCVVKIFGQYICLCGQNMCVVNMESERPDGGGA